MGKILHNKCWPMVLFAFVFLWGAYLRWIALPSASLWMDEGYSYLAAKTLLQTGATTLESGHVYGEHSVLFHAVQALSLAIFGEQEFALRLPSFVFGILTVLLVPVFLRRFFPKQPLLWFAVSVFLALSHWQIAWSIQGRMYMMLQFFFLLAFFLVVEAVFAQRGRKALCFFAGFLFFAAIAAHVHHFGLILFPLALALLPIRSPELLKKPSFYAIASMLLAVFGIWQADFLARLFESLSLHFPFYARFFWNSHLPLVALAVVSAAFVVVRGNRQQQRFLLMLLVFITVPLSVLGIFVDLVNYRYVFPLFPFLVMTAFLWLVTIENLWWRVVLLLPVLLLVKGELVFTPQERYLLESDPPGLSGFRLYTPQPDFRAAFGLLRQQMGESEILVTPYPEISRFYGIEADLVMPFTWRANDDAAVPLRPEYVEIPHVYDVRSLHQQIDGQAGYVLLDRYASERIPVEVMGYLEANMVRIADFPGADGATEDSDIILLRFPLPPRHR